MKSKKTRAELALLPHYWKSFAIFKWFNLLPLMSRFFLSSLTECEFVSDVMPPRNRSNSNVSLFITWAISCRFRLCKLYKKVDMYTINLTSSIISVINLVKIITCATIEKLTYVRILQAFNRAPWQFFLFESAINSIKFSHSFFWSSYSMSRSARGLECWRSIKLII